MFRAKNVLKRHHSYTTHFVATTYAAGIVQHLSHYGVLDPATGNPMAFVQSQYTARPETCAILLFYDCHALGSLATGYLFSPPLTHGT